MVTTSDILNNQNSFNSSLGRYYCKLTFGPYERPSPFDKSEWKPDTHVVLPLPTNLMDITSVLYGTADLGAVGDIINGGLGNVNGFAAGGAATLLRQSGALSSAAINSLAPNMVRSKMNRITNSVLRMVGSEFSSDKITSALQQSLGVSPNPNPSVMFQGPHLREFQFSWTFSAKNQAESNAIKKLIKTLKTKALPRNFFKGEVSILEYPDICQLNFYPWDGELTQQNEWGWSQDSIIRIKKCVMSNVSVQYNPSNVPAFFVSEDPVVVRIDIAFKEIEYILSNDWGGEVGDIVVVDQIKEIAGKAIDSALTAGSNAIDAIRGTVG